MFKIIFTRSPAVSSSTDDFNSYTIGQFLSAQPNWSTSGDFEILTGGQVGGNVSGNVALGIYTGGGFTANENHRAECTLGKGEIIANAHGVAVRASTASGGSAYVLYADAGTVYFGLLQNGSSGSFNTFTVGVPSNLTNFKLALEVTGGGSSTRVSAYMDTGSGWTALELNRDFGVYLTGSPGIAGYGDARTDPSGITITSFTQSNL